MPRDAVQVQLRSDSQAVPAKSRLSREFKANIAPSGAIFVAVAVVCFYEAGGPGAAALLLNVVFIITLSNGIRSLGSGEKRSRRARGWRNAVANLGVPLILALAILTRVSAHAAQILMVALCASIGASFSDSISHDVGIFDPVPRSVITWRRVNAGEDGAVSPMGSFAGFAAALLHSLLCYGLNLVRLSDLPLVFCAACLGNLADSVLGATLQNRGALSNGMVNLASTTFAALIVIGVLAPRQL
jgi:uncharacterized protein (TIGR00297 family)